MKTGNAKPAPGRMTGWNVFIVLGSLMVLGGIVWSAHTAWFASHATKVSGQIIELRSEMVDAEGSVHYAVFQFSDASGVVHTQRAYVYGGCSLGKDQKVPILYDPADPEDSTIDSFHPLWWRQSFLTAFGLVFGGFGCISSFFRNRP